MNTNKLKDKIQKNLRSFVSNVLHKKKSFSRCSLNKLNKKIEKKVSLDLLKIEY